MIVFNIKPGELVFQGLVVSVFTMFLSLSAYAGELSDFEKDISENIRLQENKINNHNDKGKKISDEFFDVLFDDLFDELLSDITVQLVEGGRNSNGRINNLTNAEANQREVGDMLIPFLRVNANTQHVSDRIDALDLKLEIGKGRAGFEVRITKYQDEENEKLEYHQFQYLHRMSIGDKVGVNLGLGYGSLKGLESFSGGIISMPILFHNGGHYGLEIRPLVFNADGVKVSDTDVSILYTYRKLALRVGHRSLKSPNQVIDGYYIGIDMIY